MWITDRETVMGAFRHRRQPQELAYDLLPPDRSFAAGAQSRFTSKPDIVDAEFVTVPSGRTRAASAVHKAGRAVPRGQDGGADARRRGAGAALQSAETFLQRASRRTFVAFIVASAVLIFGLTGGFSGLSGTPASANTDPLQFTHVTVTPRDENGMRVLVVTGIIENQSGATLSVPTIRADVVSGGQLLSGVAIDPPVDRIEPHQSYGFTARMPHPGGKAPDVRLSFLP
jgi:hypothetical protein